jgi:DNA-binding MarR family transcriptional regulator
MNATTCVRLTADSSPLTTAVLTGTCALTSPKTGQSDDCRYRIMITQINGQADRPHRRMERKYRPAEISCYDMRMRDLTSADYRALADFRYQIRRFLHFSEQAARTEGLEPQQHQMLLAIKALDDNGEPTVGRLAEFLFIRHHSAVGLIDRLEERQLVKRIRSNDGDRRQVSVRITDEGENKLRRLTSVHRSELITSDPGLVKALQALLERKNEQI